MKNFTPSTPSQNTVVVGMSGGVDSSVAAYLLKKQGYNVIGLFMKNWDEGEEDGACPATIDYDDVIAVCETIGIPCYSVNFVKEYWDRVFAVCLDEYKAGHTPNPDILCNKEIKFQAFLNKAFELEADYIATGHYCRNIVIEGTHHLAKGCDANKDQSYFLYTLTSEKLKKVLFPIGAIDKAEIKAIAREQGLITADKKESMGICFIGKRDFKPFLQKYISATPGDFITPEGKAVGHHDGIAYYTIGQRKGLGIGGPGEPWFVVSKDIENNTITVVQGEDHPLLHGAALTATEMHWIAGKTPKMPLRCTAKIRYRHDDVPCTIFDDGGDRVRVEFDSPQKAITPRQSMVLYDGEICLGGGFIEKKV
jgi:tRNA-uridine 2-sulfurtransferase